MKLLLEVTANTAHFPEAAVLVLAIGFTAAVTIGSVAWYNSKRPVGWKEKESSHALPDSDQPQKNAANYDRQIISAETAARMEREGDNFKTLPESESSLDTSGGYTVNREGLLNNYPIEPEMYINEPGDLREKTEAEKAKRIEELEEINSEGGKGPGLI